MFGIQNTIIHMHKNGCIDDQFRHQASFASLSAYRCPMCVLPSWLSWTKVRVWSTMAYDAERQSCLSG